jgi:hypothetical protein
MFSWPSSTPRWICLRTLWERMPDLRTITGNNTESSVADPDPSDPYDFGPHGSGSFYHHAKIVRKTLILNVLWLFFDFLSSKNDVNVPSKSNNQKDFFKVSFWRSVTKIAWSGSESGSGSISQRHGYAVSDPHQNIMDPRHWQRVRTR